MKTNEPSGAHLVTYVTNSFLDTEWLTNEEAVQKQAAMKKTSKEAFRKAEAAAKVKAC